MQAKATNLGKECNVNVKIFSALSKHCLRSTLEFEFHWINFYIGMNEQRNECIADIKIVKTPLFPRLCTFLREGI